MERSTTDPRRPADRERARQGRIVAIVIAVSGLLAFAAPALTATLGLPVRWEMLAYLVALAGFVWALVVTFRIWRSSRDE